MAYTKAQRELYQAIYQEALGNGETPEEAELTAHDYLYYTRQELRLAQDDGSLSSNMWHKIPKA